MKSVGVMLRRACRVGRIAVVIGVVAFVAFTSFAATYYKVGTDAGGTSSFIGNVSSSVGWSTTSGASTTETVSDFENSDFVVNHSLRMRIPATDEDIAFTGKSITLTDEGMLVFKRKTDGGTRNVTVADMKVSGTGGLAMAQDKTRMNLKGALAVESGSTLSLEYGMSVSSGDWRYLTIGSTLTGDATTAIHAYGSGHADNRSALTLDSAEGFYGTIISDNTAYNLALTVNGRFNGTVTSLPASTRSAVFDYDGLPPETGLRIASTTIPDAIKTKLSFYSPAVDFGADGVPLVTFPAGTQVNAEEFSITYSRWLGGTALPLALSVATNADDTVSVVTKAGYTFYKIGNESAGTSSFVTNKSASVGWSTDANASATTPFSAEDMAISHFVVSAGKTLRTPEGVSSAYFKGQSLRLEETSSTSSSWNLMLKSSNGATVTIPNLISDGGSLSNGNGDYTYTLAGRISIVSGSSFNLYSSVETS